MFFSKRLIVAILPEMTIPIEQHWVLKVWASQSIGFYEQCWIVLGYPYFMKPPISFRGLKPSTRYSPLGPTLSEASPIRSVATDLAGVAMERCQADDPGDLHIFETVDEVFSEGDEITTDRKLNWFVNQFFCIFLMKSKIQYSCRLPVMNPG